MAAGFEFQPEAVPQFAFVALTYVLAVALIRLRPNRANVAFALFLVLWASWALTNAMARLADDVGTKLAILRMNPVVWLPAFAALVVFSANYPKPRWWIGTSRTGLALLFAATLLLEVAYFADHGLFITYAATAEGGVRVTSYGPLTWIDDVYNLWFTAMVLAFAWLYARSPPGPRRSALILVSLGFALVELRSMTGHWIGLYDRYALDLSQTAEPQVSYLLFQSFGRTLALVLTLGLLARQARGSRDAQVRTETRHYLAVAPLPVLMALLERWLSPTPNDMPDLLVQGLWRLAFPLLVTYALVRHRLFEIDVKIKWTVKQSTVAGAFVAVFFIASEGTQALFSSSGTWWGIGAAALLVFAIAPLQRFAERVANTAMPNVRPIERLGGDERARVYREFLEDAWRDGKLDVNERLMLKRLRERLGLSMEEAGRLELEVRER